MIPRGPADVRQATPSDARAIAEVHVRSRRNAYSRLLSSELLSSESVEARERLWDARLADPDGRCWVAEHDGAICGFAYTAAARDEDVAPRCAELFAIYLLPEHTDRGHGRRLVEHSLADLGYRGFEEVVLWVAVENEKAVGFYEHLGFAPDPRSEVVPFGDTGLRKRRFARPSGRASPAPGSD